MATTYIWNGSTSTAWNNQFNWTPTGVPGLNDTIYVTNLANINLASPVKIGGTFYWSNGTLSGSPLTITSSGVLNVTGSVNLENAMTNGGTVTLADNANITLYNNHTTYLGGIDVLAGAVVDIQTNGVISSAGYGYEYFNNAGTIRRSSGAGTAAIYASFANTGIVTNEVGTLAFFGGGTLAGTYGTASGALINFGGGSFTMGAPPAITGAGLCEFTGTQLTLTQNVPANLLLASGNLVLGSGFQNGGITNLTLNGSTLISTNTVKGTLTWASGTVTGPLNVANSGILNIAGPVNLENALTNAGTVTMTSYNCGVTIYNNHSTYLGGVYNKAGATWDLQTNATVSSAGYGYEYFINAGTFSKSGGTGIGGININFANNGVVTNQIGTLNFGGGGVLSGVYGVAAGATVNFNSGNFTMDAPPTIAGTGICEFTGTQLTLTQNAPANLLLASGNLILTPTFQNGGITNLTLNGSTLTSTNTVKGTFTWLSGTVTGPLSVASGGILNIAGPVNLENVLTNAGTVTMTGGNSGVTIYNNHSSYLGGVYVLPGGMWDMQTNATISSASYGYEYFINAGTFSKSGGTGLGGIYINFANNGVVTNQIGTLNFGGGGILSSVYGVAAGATVNFSSGNFTMDAPPTITGTGVCEFVGTTLTLTQNVPTNLLLASGNLILAPTFQNGGITNLTLAGATLTSTNIVKGTFTWLSGTVTGPLSVASGGILNIAGPVNLENALTNAGTVTMTGYNCGVMIYNNHSSYLGGVYILPGGTWDLQTNATVSSAGYGYEYFINAGTFSKSGSTGTGGIYINFANNGMVTNQIGTLNFGGGGVLSGVYGVAAGATINFNSGNFTMDAPPAITGAGLCEFTGTQLTLTQNVPANLLLASGNLILTPTFQNGGITNLTLAGATLTSTNIVKGMFDWASGTITGPLSVAKGGVLNISGAVSLENVVTNAGTVTMTGSGSVTLYNNHAAYLGGVYNLTNALWDIQNAGVIANAGYGFEFFTNAGTVQKSTSSGSSGIYVSFANGGTVTNQIGILNFGGGGALTGVYGVAAGATINFNSGNFTMAAPPIIAGTGLCEFTGTQLTLTQNVPANLVLASGTLVVGPGFQNGGITNLTLSGANLASTNTVKGTLTWTSGTITGPLNIPSGGILNITGPVSLENTVTNAGTVTMTGNASLTIYNNHAAYLGGVANLAGALWDIQTNANMSSAGYGYEFFNNAGTFSKSGGTTGASISVNFTNTGTVKGLIGTLSFFGSFSTAGGTLTFGVSSLSTFGQINISGNVALNGTASATWLNGFAPAVGNSFALLNYGSHSGTFANIALPAGSMGQGNYGATVFSLQITNATTVTGKNVYLDIELVSPNTVAVLWPTSAAGYTLQTKASLPAGGWNNITAGITTVGTNYVYTIPANGQAAFFRLQSP